MTDSPVAANGARAARFHVTITVWEATLWPPIRERNAAARRTIEELHA